MAKSQLELAAERFNAQLKAVDDAAVRKMLRLYEPARKRLLVKITQLIEAIEKGKLTTAGDVYKLDRWTDLVNQIDREIARISPTAAQIVEQGQGTATTMAQDHSVKLAQSAVPAVARAEIAASWNKVPTKAIDQLVGRLQDGSPIREWIDEVAPKMIARFEEEIVAGMTQGQHPSVISARLGGIVDVEQSRLDQMVRDSVLNSYRSASLNTYAENESLLDGWQWLSARDDTVCGSCLGLDDGRIFPLSETFFEAHSRCRCSPSPVVSGFPPIQRETGEEWLKKQSDEHQDNLLGKAAGQSFRDGNVKLEDFISKRTDDKWGDSFVQGSFRDAEKRAAARMDDAVAVVPEPVTFTPAETLAEARDFAMSLGVESFDGGNLQTANYINEALGNLRAQGHALPSRVVVRPFGNKSNLGAYYASSDTLTINKSSTYFKDAAGGAKKLFESGWMSNDDPFSVIYHEVGHKNHMDNIGLERFENGVNRKLYNRADIAQKEVSRYAATNELEFVAEVFSGRLAGNTYSDEIMNIYAGFGGPPV